MTFVKIYHGLRLKTLKWFGKIKKGFIIFYGRLRECEMHCLGFAKFKLVFVRLSNFEEVNIGFYYKPWNSLKIIYKNSDNFF